MRGGVRTRGNRSQVCRCRQYCQYVLACGPMTRNATLRISPLCPHCSNLVWLTLTLLSRCPAAFRGLTQAWKEEFPPYNCEQDSSLSPYKLESSYTTSPSANGVRVCFTGSPVQRCPAGDSCCSSTDFYKLELRVRPTCRHAIRSVTVNGVPAAVAPTFEVRGERVSYGLPYGSREAGVLV